jgi:hypothetical protein
MYDEDEDEEYDRRQDLRDEYAAEMAEEKSQGYKYHCSDRMCGASDCGNCRNGAPPWEAEDDDGSIDTERPWLADSGYDFDRDNGEWSKTLRSRKHTCRRDHADGTVRRGDVYSVTATRTVSDETGESTLAHRKYVSKRFGTGTVLAGPWSSTDAGGGAVSFDTNAPKVLWVSYDDAKTLGLNDGDAFDPAGLGAFEHNPANLHQPIVTRAPLYKIVHAARAMNLVPADAKTRERFMAKQSTVPNPAGGFPVEAHVTLEYFTNWSLVTPSGYSDKTRDYADPAAFSRAQDHTIRIFGLPVAP